MSDADLLHELIEAIRNDSDAPTLEQRLNPTDPIEIEIVLHEADFAVDLYMEKWKAQFRDRFDDPTQYDAFVLDFQMRVRKEVKEMISVAQQYIAEEREEKEEEDDDGYVI